MASTMLPTNCRSCGRRGGIGPAVGRTDRTSDVGGGFELVLLVEVFGFLVAGEVDHPVAGSRASLPIEKSTALPRPPPHEQDRPVRPESPSALPVGPMTTTGSPGSQRGAQPRRAADLEDDHREQSALRDRPRRRSGPAPRSSSGEPPITRRAALEVLQAEELAGLEVRAPPRARGRRPRRSSASAGRPPRRARVKSVVEPARGRLVPAHRRAPAPSAGQPSSWKSAGDRAVAVLRARPSP